MQIFQTLLGVIIQRIKYPNWCTFQENNLLSEHEEDYIAYREELVTLFTSLAMIKGFHETLIAALA